MHIKTYIGLGSNLDEPVRQIRAALQALASVKNTQLLKVSSLYQSKPYGPVIDQPDFINAVAELESQLSPSELLAALQQIEQQHQRRRELRWGPRTLDLDILLYGTHVLQTAELMIPHPELHKRSFVLYPLAELNPALVLPSGQTVQELLLSCSSEGLKIISNA